MFVCVEAVQYSKILLKYNNSLRENSPARGKRQDGEDDKARDGVSGSDNDDASDSKSESDEIGEKEPSKGDGTNVARRGQLKDKTFALPQ